MTTDTAVEDRLDRREFVAELLRRTPDALVVTGLGSPAYDVNAAGYRAENFFLLGAMGGAVPCALGLAIAQPERSVVVVTGDGEHLMNVGALAVVGVKKPKNLTIVVLDNGFFAETGMQPSHSGLGTDLAAIARGFGLGDATVVETMDAVDEVARKIAARDGAAYFHVLISTAHQKRSLPSRDGVTNKVRFRAALGLETY
ncbi:thiamine pyrophosphate-dependent enzyme [Microbacterium aoyamense]|uniref:Thiamine pyrophosphate-dependent enzyme n=1 Tax=Microbacterium aoyamense TaxID=344166 RepID=A0ABP5ATL0_9MICO|nr:thiamine pyrophosphate-dependent enzyme [Microbacterium aoyamense]